MSDEHENLLEFVGKIVKLHKEYPQYVMTLIISEPGREWTYITGDSCIVCSSEQLQEFIEDNNVEHLEPNEAESKEVTH